jgi:hypothetical protein
MKQLFLILTVIFSQFLFSQRNCGTPQKMKEFFKANPDKVEYSKELRKFLENPNNLKRQSRTASVVTVPVVVHVLYKDATQNITDAQIQSQLAVLNNDFRKLNSDFSAVVPSVFQPYGADLEIAFCLATKDPNGNATNGIVRKSVPSSFVFDDYYYTPKGDLAWDTSKYLNIWVGAFTDTSLLGWAYLPDAVGATDLDGYFYDGLCIGYQYFGTNGTVVAPYNKGRTATHEIGHYFGLNHPWGEDESSCGDAFNDDGVQDTPGTNNPYFGKPAFPNYTNVCDTTTYPNGAMFMNFMDYVDDDSMAFFTNGQKTITKNTLSGPRASLLNSNACSNLAVSEIEKIEKIVLFPNPSSQFISISSPLINANEIEIFDNSGKLVLAKPKLQDQEKIDIRKLPVGIYYVRIYKDGKLLKSDKFIKK